MNQTEERLRGLARELSPVRPIPRLRLVGGLVLAVGVASFALDWALGGSGLRAASDPAWTNPLYLGGLAGLALLALGAASAALGAAVPGRERVQRAGRALAATGVLLGVAAGFTAFAQSGAGAAVDTFVAGFPCVERGLKLGIASASVIFAFGVFAALRPRFSTAALTLAGGLAVGALAVHGSCESDSPLHQLMAHSLPPLLIGLCFALPLAALLRSLTHR